MAMASVDKDSVERNFSHGAPTYDGAATVQRAMAARLSEIWREVSSGRRITDVVEIYPGTGLFTRAYLGWLRGANLEFWDLAAIGDDLPGKNGYATPNLRYAAWSTTRPTLSWPRLRCSGSIRSVGFLQSADGCCVRAVR